MRVPCLREGGIMRVSLAVNRVTQDVHSNLESIICMIQFAAQKNADLVLLPEAALTGLINRDDPGSDLPLGEPIPGRVTARLAGAARESGIFVGLGLLERAGERLYDSALLFDSDGRLALGYRRVSPGWHGPDADAAVYGEGGGLHAADTSLGRITFLICGDLFTVKPSEVAELSPDWLLVPYARCSDDPEYGQVRWETGEEPHYVARVAELGVTSFMTNYLAASDICRGMCGECRGGAHGGAMAVSAEGSILAKKPLGEEGLLVVDA